MFSLITLFLVLLLVFVSSEVLLCLFDSQKYIFPRWEFSSEYGSLLPRNQIMTQGKPGHYKFSYQINQYRYRGEQIPVSNTYENSNIVVLGDSYTFGHGVDDGEEYPAVLSKAIGSEYNVINLGVGGWGLTQQIRRYYELGQLYAPEVVILMFCSNDPGDNMRNRVTIIDSGRFKFQTCQNENNWIKKYLANSRIQKSQLYNFIRNRLYRILSKSKAGMTHNKGNAELNHSSAITREEAFYNDLLELFAQDLKNSNIEFLMISVPDQLESFKHISSKVAELDAGGLLNYIEVTPWFEDCPDKLSRRSPEGHPGAGWHDVIGRGLSEAILSFDQ